MRYPLYPHDTDIPWKYDAGQRVRMTQFPIEGVILRRLEIAQSYEIRWDKPVGMKSEAFFLVGPGAAEERLKDKYWTHECYWHEAGLEAI